MKTFAPYMYSLFLAVLLSLGFAYPEPDQGSNPIIAKIEQAILKNDAQLLSAHFNASVEISINNKQGVYNKDQAQLVIKEFFMNYPVRSFRLLHSGSKDESFYLVGNYQSARGSFETSILVRKAGDHHVIDHISFESSNS